MIVIAALSREGETSGKGCTRLQLNRIATGGTVQSGLQVIAGVEADHRSRRWRIGHRTQDGYSRQFRRPIEGLRHAAQCGHQYGRRKDYRNEHALLEPRERSGTRICKITLRLNPSHYVSHSGDLDVTELEDE